MSDAGTSIDVLLIEDNPGDARLVEHHLNESHVADIVGDVTLEHEETLAEGLRAIEAGRHDILFLDLGLPESTGLATLGAVQDEDPRVPIVVLTGLDDRETAVTAIQRGAQDYLLKDDLDADDLARSLRYAVERHRQEAQLRLQNERLEEFTSVVSHDLRNPLNVAHARVNILRDEADNDHLETASRALDRMEALIEDLLTLAQQGRAIDDLSTVRLDVVAEDCRENVDTSDADVIVDTDATVRADGSRLQELLGNLLRNSIEHGGAAVTITLGDLADGFYVADDGPGISADDREQVFEMGYSTSEGGTGFGLMIVEGIAEAHGWDVRVTESEAGGARFEITSVDVH
ncbi:response regulator receiver sensor signal transduction histidine kinase [Halorhabdus utahensis DSM 12940]|uniref:histidine kinase n=1 Tax=Halorhabdus utahensis (strain DSM 12940 / JCM 11049 / AX-2) TaxID=519442 RepID=C7NSF3_HALUD|nr:HAMP domain-containing sensor histidine kinase [Halorhabdus utahensis]ACV12040.1 response regulator receiver sensor signal transduction histidine kinase [Halorhabdus utahensis DSM 12940]